MATAATASSFLNTLGVNTHLGSPSYLNATTLVTELNYIGFQNVRSWAPAADNSNISEWAALAQDGINFDFTISYPSNISNYITQLDNFVKQYPGHVKYAEGPNEIFDWPQPYNGLTGMAAGRAMMGNIYAAVHGDLKLAGIPVVNLTTGNGSPSQTYALLGNMQNIVDLGNAHVYPFGTDPTPYDSVAAQIPWETSVTTPNLPTVMTETGYYTMPDGSYGVNLHIQANYTLDLLLDADLIGVKSTYLYDLVDDASDPGKTNIEDHFGLFNTDGSPKPVATALHNLTTIFADPGDNASTSIGLNYTLSGFPSNGHSMQLVKASGADDIAVWAEPNIWNEASATEAAPPTSDITISLGGTYQTVSVFDPTVGTAAIATYSNVSSVNLAVTDHPLIVEVAPNSATPSPNNTVVLAGSARAIIDASGNKWTITAGGGVAVNGFADTTTENVTELAYENGLIWQENINHLWWSKTSPNATWRPSGGTATSPVPAVPITSPNDTVVIGTTAAIIDASGNKWTITAGGGVAVNGVADTMTSNVIKLDYTKGLVWQENINDLWWSKTSPLAVWGPAAGTATPPISITVTDQATGAATTIDATKVQNVTDYGASFSLTAAGVAKVSLGITSNELAFTAMARVTLTAGPAAATVVADGGTNTFTAGKGKLDVAGGTGRDSYIYHRGDALLTVEDFAATKGDTLTIDNGLKASLVTALDGHGGTMLTFGSSGAGIDLKGTPTTSVTNIHWV